ncbi:MAG: hypothetical protein K9G76_04565 [Bacteroidales bacterium]|nr:hypothetical protein [Bacteroidales bacterium]MCF8402950.1 hypothetical protein [Bacteroidales bacterium]
MKKLNRFFPGFLFSISSFLPALIFSAILMVVLQSCGPETDDVDDTSLVTGDCEYTGIQINLEHETLQIPTGGQASMEVQVIAISNCNEYVREIVIGMNLEGTDPELEIDGCLDNDCGSNTGACDITINVDEGTMPGTYNGKINASAYADEALDISISGEATFEVVVFSIPDFTIVAPNSIGLVQDNQITTAINVNRSIGHTTDINLILDEEYIPPHITYNFDPNPVPPGVESSQLTLWAGANSVPNTFNLQVTGSDGEIEKDDIFTVFLIAPFYLTLSQESIEIAQGQTGTLEVFMNRIGGYNFVPINLTSQSDIIGVGDDFVEVTFDPNPSESASSIATLSVGSAVIPGSYPVTFKGTVNALNKYITFNLTVTE